MNYYVQAICFNSLHPLGTIELGSSDPNKRIATSLVESEFLLDRDVLINVSAKRKVIVVTTTKDEPILILRREDVQVQ